MEPHSRLKASIYYGAPCRSTKMNSYQNDCYVAAFSPPSTNENDLRFDFQATARLKCAATGLKLSSPTCLSQKTTDNMSSFTLSIHTSSEHACTNTHAVSNNNMRLHMPPPSMQRCEQIGKKIGCAPSGCTRGRTSPLENTLIKCKHSRKETNSKLHYDIIGLYYLFRWNVELGISSKELCCM